MKNYLSDKMLLDGQHGHDCTVEVCFPGYPDEDALVFQGPAGECLRFIMDYELPLTGDAYLSFTTNQDNYCGYNFEEIAYRMGLNPEHLEEMLGLRKSVDDIVNDAVSKAGESKGKGNPPEIEM